MGYGAFTAPGVHISKGQWLDEYIGELYPLPNPDTPSTNPTPLYQLWIPGTAIIDASRAGNWTRFVNSSCRPNVRVWGESVGKKQIVLFQAIREIGPEEEIAFQYGGKYFLQAGLECRCGVVEGGHLPGGERKEKKKKTGEEREGGEIGRGRWKERH